MGTSELMLLALAISLDTFAVMMIEGSMLHKIDHFDLLKVGVFFGSWQTLVAALSAMLTHGLITIVQGNADPAVFRRTLIIIAIAAFLFLGAMMILKRSHPDSIVERRQSDINIIRILVLSAVTSIDSLFAGIGLGALNISVAGIFFPFTLLSITAVVAGVFAGYWFGFEHKKIAYNVSGILLFVLSLDLVFQAVKI